MEKHDLLVEIGTEELPPGSLLLLSESFAAGIRAGFETARLACDAIEAFATPRRLAAQISGLAAAQQDTESFKRGPALSAAFDAQGSPTHAALGFARSCEVGVEDLQTRESDKGRWLGYPVKQKGLPTTSLIPEIIARALAGLPVPKRMRWGASDIEFVRPVHWLVLLYGSEIVAAEILGLRSGRHTHGHRFLCPQPLRLATPGSYAATLEQKGKVLPSFAKRRDRIRAQVESLGAQCGGTAVIDPELLDEVTALVEWPVAFTGSFDPAFLDLPPEVLIATLKHHQKYFHVVDAEGRLAARFIGVSNIESARPELIRQGNERVVDPRLKDAAFFWDQDRRRALASHIEGLQGIVFQDKLGTLHDKCGRVAALSEYIVQALDSDPELARRAAWLSKCDLLSDMVGEFPELQGIMGRYYAEHSGEPAQVCQAVEEQYLPRQAGGALPRTETGLALALADKLDTLVGIFAIGLIPRSDSDPYALRRFALGVLRMLIESQIELDLEQALARAAAGFNPQLQADKAVAEVFDFMLERLRRYYLDQGVTPGIFESVLCRRPTKPYDFDRRIKAVAAFAALPEAASLAIANKRVANILKKSPDLPLAGIDTNLLVETAEKELASCLETVTKTALPKFDRGDYTSALVELAKLKESVDQFFDQVMVLCDDMKLRKNRLALLHGMHDLFLRVADISRLQV
ncbi:MAG: glycine--tRNA ligase subunit beta [Gammaproteobacteria bacterium]